MRLKPLFMPCHNDKIGRTISFVGLALCFLFALPPKAFAAPTHPIVLVWGDSLSAGYGIAQKEAWPTLLQEKILSQGLPHKVVNRSVSGTTTAEGLSRLHVALKTLKPEKPWVFVLALGANDALRGLNLSQTQKNLTAMIEMAKKQGARVVLVGIRMPPNYGPEVNRALGNMYKTVSREEKTLLVADLLKDFGSDRNYFQSDGIHPTAAAQPLIVDTVWPTIRISLGQ